MEEVFFTRGRETAFFAKKPVGVHYTLSLVKDNIKNVSVGKDGTELEKYCDSHILMCNSLWYI
jgi:hypothetical protein